ncbi:MAG: flavodoxin domain-containing protein, partial [Coriobacteriales bacterium]|nr:flavodoxin domain-containing protein [Coriobacteriales bacterium]
YTDAVHNYFSCIFSPFKSYVLEGLEKLGALDVELACTSHGPILTRGHEYEKNIERYRSWATPDPCAHKRIPVFYCSAYGNTEQLATHVAHGVSQAQPTAEVRCYDLIEHPLSELTAILNESDAFLIGSPTINRDALPPVWNLLAGVDAVAIAKRPAALFGSYGWSGEAIPHLTERLQSLKVAVFESTLKVAFTPTAEDLAAAEALGLAFGESLGVAARVGCPQ